MSSLEEDINDEKFVNHARELTDIKDPEQRTNIFISLIQNTFFYGVVKHLGKIQRYVI